MSSKIDLSLEEVQALKKIKKLVFQWKLKRKEGIKKEKQT